MRTLLAKLQAERDDVERIYQPTVEILFNIDGSFCVETLSWRLGILTKEHPWKDKRICILNTSETHFEDEPYEVESFSDFLWDETKRCFRTGSNLVALRRGQLMAFENWVQSLVDGFVETSLPNIRINQVYGRVTYMHYHRPKINR